MNLKPTSHHVFGHNDRGQDHPELRLPATLQRHHPWVQLAGALEAYVPEVLLEEEGVDFEAQAVEEAVQLPLEDWPAAWEEALPWARHEPVPLPLLQSQSQNHR